MRKKCQATQVMPRAYAASISPAGVWRTMLRGGGGGGGDERIVRRPAGGERARAAWRGGWARARWGVCGCIVLFAVCVEWEGEGGRLSSG